MTKLKKNELKKGTHLRLREGLMDRVRDEAHARRTTITSIVEAALEAFFEEKDDMRQSKRYERRLARIEDSQKISLETLARFISVYFANTPEVPPEKAGEASRRSRERYEKFTELVAQGLGGKRKISRSLEDIAMLPKESPREENIWS